MNIPAKAIICDALIYLDVKWSAAQIRTALVLADHMFGNKRDASVSAATLARRRRVHETRVREHLAELCRRPDEGHDLLKHAFVRTYTCIPWGDGRRGGRKVCRFSLADELESAVMAARKNAARALLEAPEFPALQSVTTETPGAQAFRSIETPDTPAFHSPTETPGRSDRNAGIQATETSPRGGGESGIRNPARNPAGVIEAPDTLALHSRTWPAVAEALRGLMVSENEFVTWCRPLRAQISGDDLRVRAPGKLHADYWQRRTDVLAAAARQAGLTGRVVVERCASL